MRRVKRLYSGLIWVGCLSAIVGLGVSPMTVAAADAKPVVKIDETFAIKVALRARQFDAAARSADSVIAERGKQVDEALYLKALALQLANRHDQAVKTADILIVKHPKSSWYYKARFLKAQSLLRLKKFVDAERIYEEEANRLLSTRRKSRIVGVIVKFADALAKKQDEKDPGSPKPDYRKAYKLYAKALTMEIDRNLRDEVLYKKAYAIEQARNYNAAIRDYRTYLQEFDPDWIGSVGSVERMRGQKRQNPPKAGKYVYLARYRLVKSQLGANHFPQSRRNAQDLMDLITGHHKNKKMGAEAAKMLANTNWQLLRTYRMPRCNSADYSAAVKAARDFLAKYPDHPFAVEGAWNLAEALAARGEADKAVIAFEAFMNGKLFKLPAGELAAKPLKRHGKSPARLKADWEKLALYRIAMIRMGQKLYDKAMVRFNAYINRYPDGPQWGDAQRQLINAEFAMAVDAVAEKKYDDAKNRFEQFLKKHPLESRNAQVLFTLGQIEFAAATKLEKDKADTKLIATAYARAIDQWARLVSKYPRTNEASLALYRTGLIYEEKLKDLDKALETYRRLTWGSYASSARNRITFMTKKQLLIQTERTWRSNEKAKIKLDVRNIEKLTVRQYFLDFEAYFRKTHMSGRVEELDIALIQPDKTWELKINQYAKYKPLTQHVEIPFAAQKRGVCIVNVSNDDLEATTLVVRSDLEMMTRASRHELLVFVQNVLTGKPEANARVLLSDGKNVFSSGLTGKDGVFIKKYDELKSINTLRVLAQSDAGYAFGGASLSGLRFGSGLTRKGYIYTDRSVYQPGQTVSIKGIIREVKDGKYHVPAGNKYLVDIRDAHSRLLRQVEVKLSEYGSFSVATPLAKGSPVGSYVITARPADKDRQHLIYTGRFQVRTFQLAKMKLSFKFDRRVYFRGEKVNATISAAYYWGEPLVGKSIRYTLPDGRTYTEKTDAKGKLKVEFDTSGLTPGRALLFQGQIIGENVTARKAVYLPKLGYAITGKVSQKVMLAGEGFDLNVTTKTPDGKPVGKSLKVTVLRREQGTKDPVLSGVPWLRRPVPATADVTISEHKVSTDDKTGKGVLRLALNKGGAYVLRIAGEDRFKQTVTTEQRLFISDDEDRVKLRMFTTTDTLKVGGKTKVKLHSRLKNNLALLTFESDRIISYRIVPIKNGSNDVAINVGHEHFPNFQLAATVMDGKHLRTSNHHFKVERELKVTVEPLKKIYAPGEGGKVRLKVTDQTGKPVAAELSLAMVDQALFARFGDHAPRILDFFQRDAMRRVEFRAGSSNGFNYTATTRAIVRAYTDERDRLARLTRAQKELERVQAWNQITAERNRKLSMLGLKVASGELSNDTDKALGDLRQRESIRSGWGIRSYGLDANSWHYGQRLDRGIGYAGGQGQAGVQASGGAGRATAQLFADQLQTQLDGAFQQPGNFNEPHDQRNIDRSVNANDSGRFIGNRNEQTIRATGDVPLEFGMDEEIDESKSGRDGRSITPRYELPDAVRWFPAIVTNDKGVAIIDITMPDNTTKWRLTARGVTKNTLVGEATASLITRKDFFISLKAPATAYEGDTLQLLARLHNLAGFSGKANVKLTLRANGRQINQSARDVNIKKGQTAEFLLDAIKVGNVDSLEATLSVTAGKHRDALVVKIPVEPYGLEYADHRGGAAKNSATLKLKLPDKQKYRSRHMSLVIGPHLKKQIIRMALSPSLSTRPQHGFRDARRAIAPPIGSFPGTELLAAVSGLEYARKTKAPTVDQAQLVERVRTLVGSVVVSQHSDGGWGWGGHNRSDWAVTSTTYWALVSANAAGVKVHDRALARAENYLATIFKSVGSTDFDPKAVILHAQSVSKKADYKLLNPLHRRRNDLSAIALAYTALAFANLDRNDFASEILAVLDKKAKTLTIDDKPVSYWDGSTKHSWLNDRVETTAVALLAYLKVKPDSPNAARAAAYLLNHRGALRIRPAKARGPVVTGLAQYFGKGQFINDAYRLTILVNGQPVRTIERNGEKDPFEINVPEKLLKDGENKVEFQMNGRGEYSYAVTLRGFSSEFKDPNTWRYPHVRSRHYYHASLEYRGIPIRAASTSPVKNLEIGQRTRVHVSVHPHRTRDYLVIEEPLPAGMKLSAGSLSGRFKHHEVRDGKIVMYYPPGELVSDISYELVGYSTGAYRVGPTVIRDALNPGRMRIGKPVDLNVLKPNAKSKDPYALNDAERFALGQAHFKDGQYAKARDYLRPLFERERRYNESETARMLLWIHTSEKFFDAKRIVSSFESLFEKNPQLTIPFEKILTVGRAYRETGEYERAYLVFQATIDSSFLNDSNISAILQDEGQLLGSIDYQEDLWREYADSAQVASAYLSLSQLLYQNASRADEIARRTRRIHVPGHDRDARAKPTRIGMLRQTIELLGSFMALYPTSPLADDAAFSLANAHLDLKDYKKVVSLSSAFKGRYAKSDFVSSFQYMIALGHFWQRNYKPALTSARVVADGKSKDRDFARYILGQIHHAQGHPAEAIKWYDTVKSKYSDAGEAIDYFKRKSLKLEEVNIFRPGKPVKLTLKYRNVADAQMQVYKVDLMKLYLREKNLSKITQVNLAGINPQQVIKLKLGDGKDYVDKEKTAELKLKDEGSYLVICRGDNMFVSALVLVTPLALDVQEDPASGRVRVNVMDKTSGLRPAGVHVKAIGSGNSQFVSGDTDLRGIFVADGLRGKTTVIARINETRYAFYRGDTWLGRTPTRNARPRPQGKMLKKPSLIDYEGNLKLDNSAIQNRLNKNWDSLRRSGGKGVKVYQAK